MDGADPPIPSHSLFSPLLTTPGGQAQRGRRRLSLPDLSPLAPLHSHPPQEDDESETPPLSPPPTQGDPSEVTMSTRKRPRNSGSASRSSGSSSRSTGGPASSLSSSSSQSAMRRTTSLSDLGQQSEPAGRAPTRMARGEAAPAVAAAGPVWDTGMRRHSAGCFPVPEAAFLKACGFCKSGLGPGRDTFIYMGEVAFCSQECRQEQMNLDELKEKKCSGGSSDQSGKSSTIAAA